VTSAPRVRTVDALSGAKSEAGAFFRALSEADNFVREVASADLIREENSALKARIDELQAELRELKRPKRSGW
jgi:hypothetical protein